MDQQSIHNKLVREGHEWLAEREKKRKDFLFMRPVVILRGALLVCVVSFVVIVHIINAVAWVNKDWLGHDINMVFIKSAVSASSLAVFWAAILMKTMISRVELDNPVSSIPIGYVIYCGFLLSLELASQSIFGDGLNVLSQWIMIVMLFLLLRDFAYWENFKEEMGAFFDTRLEAIKDLPADDPLAETEPVGQKCSICQKESMYEVCLGCEQEHKGERHRVRAQILRAKQNNVPATLTLPQWLGTLNNFHWRCAYCNGEYQVMEHYIPITQGGGTTEDNCVPACFSCNGKKSDKHPESTLPVKPQYKPKKKEKR